MWIGWPSSVVVAAVVFAVPGIVGIVVGSDWEESGLVTIAPGAVIGMAGAGGVPAQIAGAVGPEGVWWGG